MPLRRDVLPESGPPLCQTSGVGDPRPECTHAKD